MIFVFPAFTLSPFSSIASFQVKSRLLTHSSSNSAMIIRSSAYPCLEQFSMNQKMEVRYPKFIKFIQNFIWKWNSEPKGPLNPPLFSYCNCTVVLSLLTPHLYFFPCPRIEVLHDWHFLGIFIYIFVCGCLAKATLSIPTRCILMKINKTPQKKNNINSLSATIISFPGFVPSNIQVLVIFHQNISSLCVCVCVCLFVCVDILWPSQPDGVMLGADLTTLLLDRLTPLCGKPVLCTFFC